jgi:pseudouridine kinase
MIQPANTASKSDNRYIVVVGDATMDIAITATSPIRGNLACCPGGPVRFKRGGCARNVAENLARLGCHTYLVTVLGDDDGGRFLSAMTRSVGVDLSASLLASGRASSHCVLVSDVDGEVFCCVGDSSINQMLTVAQLSARRELIHNAALIVANSTLNEDALAWLFTHHGNQPVFADIVSVEQIARLRPWLPKIFMIRPSREKASQFAGLPFSRPEDAAAIAAWFHLAGVVWVVLSLAEQGTYYSCRSGEAGWLWRQQVVVVNTTGAGDALTAGLAYGWLHNMPLADCVRFGLGCAALTLTTAENNYPGLSLDTVYAAMR